MVKRAKLSQDESLEEDLKAVNRVLQGDNSAFTLLQEKYQRLIFSLIRKMIKNEGDVEDLVQETFIKAFTALGSYHQDYPFSAWLYRIASNGCIDFLRKRRLQMVSLDKGTESEDGELKWEVSDVSYEPERTLFEKERKEVLAKALESLPEKYRTIVLLRHEEDLDYADIAEKLDLPLGTVKAHLFRARRLMYSYLKSHMIHFED